MTLTKKGGGMFTLDDFMFVKKEPERQQTAEEILTILESMVRDGDGR